VKLFTLNSMMLLLLARYLALDAKYLESKQV